MMIKIAILFLSLVAASDQEAAPRAGVMVAAGGRAVLAMSGPALAAGTIITLVTIEAPQRVSWAVIADFLADSDIMAQHDIPGPYYTVASTPASNALPGLAVAIVGQLEADGPGPVGTLRSDKPESRFRVRGCASSEGLHLTLWSGEPLKSARLWHTYYYLGYDLEFTCQPGDYQDGD